MGRPKKQTVAKEPVRIREQVLADGRRSLYLDIYHNGNRSYKFLKLYLVPENDAASKIANSNTLAKANAVKSEMIRDLTNRIAGISDNSHKARMLFTEWMEIYRKDVIRRNGDEHWIKRVISELKDYRPDVALADVDKEFILGFMDRQLSRKPLNRHRDNISKGTVFIFMDYIRAGLNFAVKEKLITTSPYKGITRGMVRSRQSKREYLTVQEVKKLIDTPCRRPDVKAAFLFSCFCGLRIRDVMELCWKHIARNGADWQVEIIQFKTKKPLYLPLNMSARQWLPEQGDAAADDHCFPQLSYYYHDAITGWVEKAGIEKPVTYHTSRHTFATLCLTAGIDIYTTSQLLGHTTIRHTQRYARIINSKKDDAVSMLDEVF